MPSTDEELAAATDGDLLDIVFNFPPRLLYWAVVAAASYVSTEVLTDREISSLTSSELLKALMNSDP